MNTHYLPGPGDDEDEEGNIRPVDTAPDEHADETWAVQAGNGALVD